jgi:Ca2+:H+ antiporter
MSLSRARALDKEGEAEPPEEEEEEFLSLWSALSWLCLATVAIAFISESLTGALEGAAQGWGLSDAFVGFCLLPIVGNAAE